MKRSPTRRRRDGFTLIEVLLVLAILVVISSLGVLTFDGIRDNANVKAAGLMTIALENGLDLYKNDVRSYPSTAQGLEALRTAPSGLNRPERWAGPYLKQNATLLDPWDNPYQYEYDDSTRTIRIWSAGLDGVNGTDDDIDNLGTQTE